MKHVAFIAAILAAAAAPCAPQATEGFVTNKIAEAISQIPPPDFSTNNVALVETIQAKAPAPGDYAAVSNAAVHAATTNALQSAAIESNRVDIASNRVAIASNSAAISALESADAAKPVMPGWMRMTYPEEGQAVEPIAFPGDYYVFSFEGTPGFPRVVWKRGRYFLESTYGEAEGRVDGLDEGVYFDMPGAPFDRYEFALGLSPVATLGKVEDTAAELGAAIESNRVNIASNSADIATLSDTTSTLSDSISTLSADKANDADVVHKTGNETIGGDKTFTGGTTIIPFISAGLGAIQIGISGRISQMTAAGLLDDTYVPNYGEVKSAITAEISPTSPAFSNAVLSVGLGIDTNTVAAINELVDSAHDLPVSGATSVGALLLALAAAVAALKKNLRYSYNTATVSSGTTPTVTNVADRAINTATLDSSVTAATVTLPAATANRARDFFIDLTIEATTAPTLTFIDPATNTTANVTFGADSLADIDTGKNAVLFTEFPNHTWLVSVKHEEVSA